MNSKVGGKVNSVSVSAASQSRKPATFATPRMLTPSEIKSLQQDKRNTKMIAKARSRA